MLPVELTELATGSSPRPWGTPRARVPAGPARRFIPTPVGNTVAPTLARRGDVVLRFIPTPVGNTGRPRCQDRPRSVHPHARGEHTHTLANNDVGYGSSPRPWGTLDRAARRVRPVRFIPTPVGNTRNPSLARARVAVHPHARGEHRGRRTAPAPGARFIPTPVGNTSGSPLERRSWPVHPHARGEHTVQGPLVEGVAGSSPRPWGTRVGHTRRGGRRAVHPHARGEHADRVQAALYRDGSSPRPWGTPVQGAGRLGRLRFIPTPVGNTRTATSARSRSTVHPHARGEHGRADWHGHGQPGSSPRPWGTHAAAGLVEANERFIHTPVGNTRTAGPRRIRGAVHPHARGEHALKGKAAGVVIGSSPRPWGTPIRPVAGCRRRRFIPTPVGNTWPARGRRRRGSVHPHARGEHAS